MGARLTNQLVVSGRRRGNERGKKNISHRRKQFLQFLPILCGKTKGGASIPASSELLVHLLELSMSVTNPPVVHLPQVNEGIHSAFANEYLAMQASLQLARLNGLLQSNVDALLDALKVMFTFIKKWPEDDIRALVLLRQRGDKMELIGADGGLQIRKTVPVTGAKKDFSVAVNAAKLFRLLDAVGDIQVGFVYEAGKLHIRSNGVSHWLESFPADKFPLASPAAALGEKTLSVSGSLFKSLLDQVTYLMWFDNDRSELNGLLLKTEGRQLTLAASDGVELAFGRIDLGVELPGLEGIVPTSAVDHLEELLSDEPDARLSISFAQGRAFFKINTIELATKLIPGSYPNVERVALAAYAGELTINRDHLIFAICRARLPGTSEVIELAVEEGQPVTISGLDCWGRQAHTMTVSVNSSSGDYKGRVDGTCLLRALRMMSHDEVVVQFNGPRAGLLLKAKGDGTVKHVVKSRRP